MNKYIYINLTLYIKITDSEVFGGAGSIGYVMQNLEGISEPENITEEAVNDILQGVAQVMDVDVKNVKLVSKEEYERGTDDDEEWEE